MRRKIKLISVKVHPIFYNIMERERQKFKSKGINNISQADLTKLIANKLNKKERALGLIKNVKKKK